MSIEMESHGRADGSIESKSLRVELEIERGGACVIDEVTGDVVDVDVRFHDERCRVDLDLKDHNNGVATRSRKQFTSTVCDHCPGAVFSKYGCIPRYQRTGAGSFVVETYLSDTDALSGLVNDIRDRCARVTVLSITSTEGTAHPEHCSVDVSVLTPKQRQAVEEARKQGYYGQCSDTELGEVADSLGISPSALSQRLQRAEANVMGQLSLECGCFDSCDSGSCE
ncbi:helix-turn-helix domain-containing protein [Halobacteriaceae archaeon SHR40]|uniref:helix-turn-helix domain-containing protein n=1 Tax=Halovenus amylolytica TaxID=2500550 RepID=UPI000FE39E43